MRVMGVYQTKLKRSKEIQFYRVTCCPGRSPIDLLAEILFFFFEVDNKRVFNYMRKLDGLAG